MSGLLSCSLTNASVLCSGKLIPYHSQASQPVFGTLHNCSEPCNGAFFSQEQVDILHYSNLVLSCLSIITGCIILFLYLINYCKIKHPEAPIYYIAGLQLVVSTMQLISGLYGNFNSMQSTNSSSDSEGLHCDDRYKNHFNESILLQDGGGNPFCLTIFAILYYSFLSILSWWTVITIEWLVISIKRKITKKKYLYIISHIAGWSIPIPFLFTAAYLNAVSGSTTEMTCWISRRNESQYQLAFIIIPLSVSLTFNSMLLLLGFWINCKKGRHRNSLYFSSRNEEVTIAQLARVSIYSVLQLVVMGLLLMCYLHQYWYQRDAEINYLQFIVHKHVPSCYPHATDNHFLFFITAILRVICFQIMGVVLLLWILRRELLCRYRCKYTNNKNNNNNSNDNNNNNNNNSNNNNNLNNLNVSRSSAGEQSMSLLTNTPPRKS